MIALVAAAVVSSADFHADPYEEAKNPIAWNVAGLAGGGLFGLGLGGEIGLLVAVAGNGTHGTAKMAAGAALGSLLGVAVLGRNLGYTARHNHVARTEVVLVDILAALYGGTMLAVLAVSAAR